MSQDNQNPPVNEASEAEVEKKTAAANKILGFKGRAQKEAQIQQQHRDQQMQQLQQMLFSLMQKTFQMEQRLNEVKTVAQISDWRSLAIMRLLVRVGITEDDIVQMTGVLQKEDFEKRSAEDDLQRNLQNADDQSAADGLTAIVEISLYKDGVELKDERIVRSKLNLGQTELFPELDRNIVGMKVGETKRFPMNVQDKTDQCEVLLVGLRKPASTTGDAAKETQETKSE